MHFNDCICDFTFNVHNITFSNLVKKRKKRSKNIAKLD